MHTYLVNAKKILEKVILPFEKVIWQVGYWNNRNPIIYADDLAILLFDFEEKTAHMLYGETHLAHQITAVAEVGGGWHDIHLELAPTENTRPTRAVPAELRKRLLAITLFHGETHQRLHTLLDPPKNPALN